MSEIKELNKEDINTTEVTEFEFEWISKNIREEEAENMYIYRYIKDNREKKIVEHEDEFNDITSEITMKKSEISKINENINK